MVKKSITLGAIGAAIVIALVLLVYLIDRQLMGNMLVGLSFMAITVVWVIISAKKVKKYLDGQIKLGQALATVVIIGITMSILTSLFTVFMYKVMDPDLQEDIIEQQVEFWIPIMEGAPQEAIDQTIQGIEEGIMGQTDPVGIAKSWLQSLIFYAFLGIIVALVIRTREKKPELAE